MAKYIVKGATVLYAKDKKIASVTAYKPGEEIELTDDDAAPIKHLLEPVAEKGKK